MTDATLGQPKASLGIGSIIGESFSILFGHFLQVVIVAFVPSLLGFLVSGALIGFNAALGIEPPQFTSAASTVAFAFSSIINIVVYSLTTALLVQLAYDAKLQRPVQLGRYFGPALGSLVPLAVLSIVAGILVGIGAMLLLIPGLWLYAVFSVMAPAVVIERVGFRGLGRSAALTKEYRWPIIGSLVLAAILIVIINMIAGVLIGLIVSAGGTILAVILFAALSTIGAGLLSIMIALIYARLREIKEGVSVDQIASVFD